MQVLCSAFWQEDVPRKVFGFLAELFFTLGALVLLFLLYQLWFTTELAKNQQALVSQEFQSLLNQSPLEGSDQSGFEGEALVEVLKTQEIEGLGLLFIPALKNQVWGLPVLSGTDDKALAQGVGHYSKTELPGQVGNFAIAGHRATNGEPFAYFENLRAGDLVYLQTTAGWFSYELVRDQKIQETEVWVLEDDPIGLGEERLITLTTCDPRWNSTRRWAWWGIQVDFSKDKPMAVG